MEQKSNNDYDKQAIRELINDVEKMISDFENNLDKIEILYRKENFLNTFLTSPMYENRLNKEMFGFKTKEDNSDVNEYGFSSTNLEMKIQALKELKETLENYYPNQEIDDDNNSENSFDFDFNL